MSKFDGLLQRKGAAANKAPEPKEPKRMGRPPGKASDPGWRQVTIYLKRGTHAAARKRLIDEETDFSDLVETLVTKWLGTAARKEK